MARRRRGSALRDLTILVLVLIGLFTAVWAARELCRVSSGCPWTVLY